MPLFDNYIPTPGHSYGGGIVQNVEVGIDPYLYRPFIDDHGKACVIVNSGRYTVDKGMRVPIRQKRRVHDLLNEGYQLPPVVNATSLRKEEWIEMDRVVLRAARQRLRAWSDLAAANTYGGFDGMAKLTLEYEAMSDAGEAVVDMDAMTPGRGDEVLFKLRSLPLPITHSDFWFSERRIRVSRNSGTPIDTTMAEQAARKVAEMVEKTTIGVETGVTYGTQTAGYGTHDGTSTVFGYTNFTPRLTKTNMTVPTGSNPEATIANIITMRESLYANNMYGPFVIYTSSDWDAYLDNDYARLGGDNASMTLRDRIRKIEGITDIRRLDFLTGTFTMLMVQMTADVARAVIGMDITTVQWPTMGGMRQNFKIMCIMVPQLRSDYNGKTGILHGTTA